MSYNFILGSFVAQLNQAIGARKVSQITLKGNKTCLGVLEQLLKMHMIKQYEQVGLENGLMKFDVQFYLIRTRYTVMQKIRIRSTPGRRYYVKSYEIDKHKGNSYHKAILTTNQGILSCSECKKRRLGGEMLVVIN